MSSAEEVVAARSLGAREASVAPAHALASLAPIARCNASIAFSGRTITLKLSIRPSAFQPMMSTPLISRPSIVPTNSSTAGFAEPFADVTPQDLARKFPVTVGATSTAVTLASN